MKCIQHNEERDNTDEVKRLDKEISILLEEDDIKWRQRAKKTRYQLGDKNTKYFHSCATQRKRRNKITIITNVFDQSVTVWKEIEVVFNNYYQNLFRSSTPTKVQIDTCIIQVEYSITPAINEQLLAQFN